jgi:type IX secretion system PorP/SprF family membrane protein|tara:strand:- start:1111 stop:2064 length:954 start_codon:yes stop_codon:yes gene_type:complete
MRNFFTLIICITCCLVAKTQQQSNYSQFYINDIVYNPAIAGSKSYNPLVIQTRQQWLGFDGAPFSTNISYHKLINENSAIGGIFNYENTTPSFQSDLQILYAFHVPLNSNSTFLSFGIAPKLKYYSINFSSEDLPPNQDPAFSESTFSSALFDVSSGLYLYNNRLSLGFSCFNMLESSFNMAVVQTSNQSNSNAIFGNNSEIMNFYTSASYRFDIINNDWDIEPTILLNNGVSQKQIINFATRIIYLHNNWTGIGYRSDGTMSFSFGFKSNKVNIGYSYDHQLIGEIMSYNYGTHEFIISFQIPALFHNRHTNFWIF